MTIVVERPSTGELTQERADIVDRLGGDEEAIRRLAAEYSLTPEQDALFRELEGVDFLLGR